jgi:farnesyl-diphosphate farnesyltransferase
MWCRDFSMDCGYKHYKKLMKEFGTVINVFLSLDKEFQIVIADITKKMGAGMNEFIQKEVWLVL